MTGKRVFLAGCVAVCLLISSACRMHTTASEGSVERSTEPLTEQAEAGQETQSAEEKRISDVTLYIGTGDTFIEYPAAYHGSEDPTDIPAKAVLKAMASLTDWNLDVSTPIELDENGIRVTFSSESSLFSGPPLEQKEEFFVYDAYQLDQMILDSVKKTLQCWAREMGHTDSDTIDVWFYGPDGGDLVLENIGITISSQNPYGEFPVS